MIKQRARVLVVDDDEKIRDLFRDLLEDRYEVETQSSPLTTLDTVRDFRPDVVILDFNMPEMNGIEVLRQIKAIAPTTPVIMVTGAAEVRLAEDAFHLGAFAYLPKPFQVPYAEHLIVTALRQRPTH
jgi:DNA-binding NtrC family response regulator